MNEAAFRLTVKLREWLNKNDILPEYAEVLEQHGYFNLSFIAGLNIEVRSTRSTLGFHLYPVVCFLVQDFEAMGLKDRGHVLRLKRCAQKLAPFNFAIDQTCLVSNM